MLSSYFQSGGVGPKFKILIISIFSQTWYEEGGIKFLIRSKIKKGKISGGKGGAQEKYGLLPLLVIFFFNASYREQVATRQLTWTQA